MKKLIFASQLIFLLTSTIVFSQQTEKSMVAKFVLEGGIEYGGDEILKVFFTNGGDQTMKAGQGGYLAVGGQFEFTKVKNLMIRTLIGIKYNTTAADNANIRLTRIPIIVVPYWKIKNDYRVGIGITSHQKARLNGDGFVPDVDFKSTLGPRVEFGYKWATLTYTAISYKRNDKTVSASSIGFSISFTLPSNTQKIKK